MPRVFPLPLKLREAQRLRQVINALVKYGFGQVVEKAGLSHLLTLGRRIFRFKDRVPLTPPKRLRLLLEELGPTFIKLGQVLSTRPDLVPQEFIEELGRLRDEVKPLPWADVEPLLEREWGAEWREHFEELHTEPIASASIAQVYEGKLANSIPIVLKVLRPGIQELVETDIQVLRLLARLVERYLPESRIYHPVQLVDEFAFTIRREMDFTVEGASAERMRQNFRGASWVVVPTIFWELSTSSILIMERLKGEGLDRSERLEEMGINRCEVARRLATVFLKQVLEDGFFHADPHPSNLLVGPSGELIYMDFGMMGYLDEVLRQSIANILIHIVRRNYEGIIREFKKVGIVEEPLDERRFKLELMGLLEPYFSKSLEGMRLGDVTNQVIHLSLRYQVRLPPELYLLGRALVLIDSNLRYLDPRMNVIEVVSPFALKILKKQKSPVRALRGLERDVELLKESIRDIPPQLLQSLQRINRGEFKVTFVHKGLEELSHEMERSTGRICLVLLFSLFVILGTWSLYGNLPGPIIFKGLPLLAAIFYGCAAIPLALLIKRTLFRRG